MTRLKRPVDPIDRTLERLGREFAQQTRARDHFPKNGGDLYERAERERFQQGRWAFYEAARLLCQFTRRDFDAWLAEWRDDE